MARTATVTKTNRNAVSRRKRREVKPRHPRTYYAVDKAGLTLYRFANFPQRLAAMKKDKNLIPIGALDFRNKLVEDAEGKIKVIDLRIFSEAKSHFSEEVTPSETSTPVQDTSQNEVQVQVTAQSLASVIENAIRSQFGDKFYLPVQGANPPNTQLANQH